MDFIYTYFRQNLDGISKEQLLEALKSALESAAYWREACMLLPLNRNQFADVKERIQPWLK